MAEFETRREERKRLRRERGDIHNSYDSRIWTGVFMLIVGGVALLRSFDFPIPDWLFSWQSLLIASGIFIGLKHNFQSPTWLILILVGTAFLLNEFFFLGDLRKHIWPIVIIAVGIFFIFRPKNKNNWRNCSKRNNDMNNTGIAGEGPYSQEDFIDATSIFGSTKKNILSKNFSGGDITNIFGGTELNLTQADIQGTAVIDLTTIFGGTELVVPSNWAVKSEAVTIFGGIEDKRSISTLTEISDKVLVIKGTIIFGGVEIKSYKR